MLTQRPPSALQLITLTILIALVLVALVSLIQLVEAWDPEKPFRDQQISLMSSLAEDVPQSLTFSSPGNAIVIASSVEIREFILLLVESERLEYHHSHPEDEFTFAFDGRPEVYALGVDSQNPDEYWLQLKTDRDLERGFRATIKILRSQALTSWLERNRVPSGPPVASP